MEEKEITLLARELAADLYNDDKAYNTILWWGEEPKERKAEELEYTLCFLLRRYCLVEKRKLIEEYKSATANFNNASDPVIPTMDYYLGIMKFIESLFPEIAKEAE